MRLLRPDDKVGNFYAIATGFLAGLLALAAVSIIKIVLH